MREDAKSAEAKVGGYAAGGAHTPADGRVRQAVVIHPKTDAIGTYDFLKGLEIACKNCSRPLRPNCWPSCLFRKCFTLSYFAKRLHRKIAIIR
jgi:hypothetical protein